MLAFDLLVPCTMIGFGRLFLTKAPKNINYLFGYRTSASMKNRATWEFAHRYIGTLWYRLGWLLLVLTLVLMLFFFGKDVNTVGNVSIVLVGIQLIPLVGSIIPTETALKRNFDQFGRKKS